VFNLFVVSVFWSFMADLYDTDQARRLYGFIAAGGSLGAIGGPSLASALALPLGPVNLLLVSATLLLCAVVSIGQLTRWSAEHITPRESTARRADAGVGGGILAGFRLVLRSRYLLAICLYVALYSVLSTFLYFQQQQIVKATIAVSEQRTALFAMLDLVVNVLTLVLQLVAFAPLLRWFGLAAGLVAVPLLSLPGFVALGIAPTLAVLVVFGTLRRAAEFAICKPARETLFNPLPREEKYKAKNVMDTAVYRAGDMASGWIFTGLQAIGMGLSSISFVAAPLAALWAGIGLWLTKRHREQHATRQDPVPTLAEREQLG
jgi:AAA family ATP:ADP antiporter